MLSARLFSRQRVFVKQATTLVGTSKSATSNSLFQHAHHFSAIASTENEEENNSLFAKYGLDDWKVAMPIGAAVSLPVVYNGMYIVNEETLLATCFVIFCTSVYKYGGEMIGSFLDVKGEAILKEHNAIEDSAIKVAKQTLSQHKLQIDLMSDVAAIDAVHKEVITLACKAEVGKLKHDMHRLFVKNLDAIIGYEERYQHTMQSEMVKYATAKVQEVVKSGDAGVKENAFKNALRQLEKHEPVEGEDEVVALFGTHLKGFAAKVEAKVGTTITLSDGQMKDMQNELEAMLKRHDLVGMQMTVPKEITLALIK